MLFIGSSQCYRTYVPDVLKQENVQAFNMGSSGQTPMSSYFLLQANPKLKPSLAVLEVYWGALSDKAGEDAIDVISNTAPGSHTAGLAWQTRDWGIMLTAAAHTLGQPFSPIQEAKQMSLIGNQQYTSGGFVSHACPPLSLSLTDTFSIKHHPVQLVYLTKVIALLRARGCQRIMLVRTPVTAELLQQVTNYPQESTQMEAFARENGVSYTDFNTPALRARLNLSTATDFCDKNHPTLEGARKITTLFWQLCKEKGYWPANSSQ